ncbi:MAG TPA: glucose-1-phosphate thymidylyltransferase [Marinilabiliales bacterium]|nr:MAG: glucose-1-phosphate thymidylyltransferase [Bacteroidetes bacterium GWA2_40_14]OFX59376.1 MAG: glucose-1-phosphate thymidylyltransferase [Bacteroidetes bacterium GWC2_40_13]OFX72910.1 MAG: glucose-1-phosphate thymidylyltransferase [Bacteroidetes bacterium GWD2_40_43]OFX91557.1 MAG: glucose-1-phosphate thymidylyltransferase [Bacteroidetes bacterium GWE2_40_63]OFY19719.1 MAG: glucose-1-phosphate thymidylyltransferase [Bacteroidetes bacterium GWF2_40_13]OFZ25440.1 MAG: glucose-1-phosphate 
MNYLLFDDVTWEQMLPLTFTRPVSEIRLGILTIKEKWEKYLQATCSYVTRDYLQKKFLKEIEDDNLLINSSFIPTAELLSEIENLEMGQALTCGEVICALRVNREQAETFNPLSGFKGSIISSISDCIKINHPWDIFRMNGDGIEHDFKLITKSRKSQMLSKTNNVIGDHEIFIERGAVVEYATLNVKNGPIYIGKGAEVMENSAIRGPFTLCAHATVKMGAKIYGPTTIGPYSKVGGELNNVVIFGYSNKAHDGFLGNSVIGEWCNLGADTNNSNLKNNYAPVKLWNYQSERFIDTGLQFCGLIMGDHSKTGINTMFNTGTVVGVGANIFGDGFPRNFIPSFSWGGSHGFAECRIDTAFEIALRVMERREIAFDEVEKKIMSQVFEMTAKYRESYHK